MISFEYSKETSYNYAPGDSPSPVTTVVLTGEDFIKNVPTNVHNGARAYIIDWYELDIDKQGRIGGQLLMFDKSSKRWLKQQGG